MNLYPLFFRNAVFPFFEGAIKGRNTVHDYRDFERNLTLPIEKIKQIQLNKLQALLEHCQHHVPYYQNVMRELGIDDVRHDVSHIDALTEFPILTKQIIKEQHDELVAGNYRGKNLVKSTGGSTGTPTKIELNPDSEFTRTAIMYRGYNWMGAGVGEKTLYLWGANLGHDTLLKKLKAQAHEWVLNRKTLNTFNMHQNNIDEFIKKINQYKPTALVSYTTPLFLVAKYALDNNIKLYSPKSIITGAESLNGHQREVIEKAFKADVFNSYGCREVMLIGAECQHKQGFHLNIDHLVVETIDNNGQSISEQAGDIVITDLSNYGMPLIRYQNGDLGILSRESCRCSNPLPMLREISGRKVDVLKTPEGDSINGLFFPHLLKEIDNVLKYQCRQSVLDVIELDLQCSQSISQDAIDYIQNQFKKVSTSVTLVINEVQDIPLTANGKHRNVICEV